MFRMGPLEITIILAMCVVPVGVIALIIAVIRKKNKNNH